MTLDKVAHKNIMLKVLKDIFADVSIGPLLGFKGGTAAMLFYGLDRFSVDLDFDLIDHSQEYHIFERVKAILMGYGQLKEAQIKRSNLVYSLSYADKVRQGTNVKVEINRRSFGSRYDVKAYFGMSMNVMVREDMAAHKLVAMVERIGRTNRDIFDVWFFLQNDWPLNKALIEQRAKMSYKEFLQRCMDVLTTMNDANLLAGMGELLAPKQKIWVKAHLKTDTIFLLNLALDAEKKFPDLKR